MTPENPISQEDKEKSALDLLDVVYDTTNSLAGKSLDLLNAEIKANRRDIESLNKRDGLLNLLEYLDDFIIQKTALVQFFQRRGREYDRVKLLAGEHRGATVQIVKKDGMVGSINFYGGIRDPNSSTDLKDSDQTLQKIHSARSEAISSHPTQVNLHLKDPSGKTLAEVWFTQSQNRITLSSFALEGSGLQIDPVSLTEELDKNRFLELKNRTSVTLNKVVRSVPNF